MVKLSVKVCHFDTSKSQNKMQSTSKIPIVSKACSTHVSPGPTADDLVVLGRLEALDGEEVEDGLEAVRGQEPPLKLPALRFLAANDPESGSEMQEHLGLGN